MNKDTITEPDKLCNSILETNSNIESVSIINRHGRAVECKVQGNPGFQATDQKNEMFFMQCALTISMGREFDKDFGEIGYVHINRKNLSLFSFPLFDNIILVTSKSAISPISLARKISTIIKKYKTQHLTTEKNISQKDLLENKVQLHV